VTSWQPHGGSDRARRGRLWRGSKVSVERPRPGTAEVVAAAPGVAVVEVCGEHDLSTEPALTRALEDAARHANVLADLSGCSFADSTALTVLIKAAQGRDGRFVAVIPPERRQVARMAELVGLGELLSLHETREAALRALAAGPGEPA
jgi:anti-sigma B factor antagonist